MAQTTNKSQKNTSKVAKNDKHIAVIGAGFTGLTTALRLTQKGYKVTLYERSDQLGGLVSGFSIMDTPLEKAYHFVYTTDTTTFALLKELGVEDRLHWYDSSISLFWDGKLYPFMTPKDLLMFKPLPFVDKLRTGVLALYLARVKNWEKFKNVTAMEWMTKYAGKRATEVVWEPQIKGKFDTYYDQISMSYLWDRIRVRAVSKEKGSPVEKLGYFRGGWKTVVEKMADAIKANGGTIVTKAEIATISKKDGKDVISFENGKSAAFDAVVGAVPNHVMAKMIEANKEVSKDYVKKLNSIDYLGAVQMVFATDKRLTDYYWHSVNDPTVPFLVLIDLTSLVDPKEFKGKYVHYIGAYLPHDHKYFTSSDEVVKKEWFAGLRKMFPDFDQKDVAETHVFRLRNAQHVVKVGYEKLIPEYKTPVDGVYLANFTQIFPQDRGTNYAFAEGQKLADMVDADLRAAA